ncbi:hypothetical protein COBT_001219 [Conglomerata obtusa]
MEEINDKQFNDHNIVSNNDIVMLYKSRMQVFILYPKSTNNQLCISHKNLIGQRYNTKFKNVYILKPYPSLYTSHVKRQTQILFEADISLILTMLDIKPGDAVIESGTGSGVLTRYLSQHVGSTGRVFTYERDFERYEILKNQFEENVKVFNSDIISCEFGVADVDSVFLDLPEPFFCVRKCYDVLKNGGRFCVFVPNVEQVIKVKNELIKYFSDLKMYENIKREYIRCNNETQGMIMKEGQYSHTGFLIFATKIEKFIQ